MEITIFKANKKKRRNKSGKRSPRYWIVAMGAMGAFVAFTVGNSHRMMTAYAQEKNGNLEIAQVTTQNFQTIKFDIPAGRLESVIEAFQKVTGFQVKIEKPEILNIQSQGVSGILTAEQALKRILTGTGVSYSFVDAKNINLSLQAESAVVTVEDTGTKPISSAKYTEPIQDVPQTITVISKTTIEQQGATTLRDVLSNVPGITITAGEGGAPAGDNLTIRGFSARNDIYIDGVRDISPQSRDPFNIEQVEVVKGPSSAFTGRGSTGGTVNLVNKLPNLRRSFAGSFSLGTDETKRGTLDINTALTNTTAFRFNALVHDSKYAGRKDVEYKRFGLAPSLLFGLGTPTRYGFSFYHLNQENVSDYGIPWVPVTNTALIAFRDRPAPVPRSTFYGFKDRDKEKLNSTLATFRYEHEFNDNITVRNQLRYGRDTRDSNATPPRFNSNTTTVINRELRAWITKDDIWDNQTDFTARFLTGKLTHAAVFGTDFTFEKNIRVLRSGPNSLTTLLDPNTNDIYTGVITVSPFVGNVIGKTAAVYFFDTVKLTKQFEFTGGFRFDRFSASGVSAATTGLTPIERIDNLLSGRAALVFKPTENGSIYGSFSTSSNPSLEGLSYSVASTAVAPEKTRNYEIGTKWGFFESRVLLTGAVFRVDKVNARTPGVNPGDPPTVLDGQQRVDGLELGATGNITRAWQVISAYTFLDSEVTKSNTAATVVNGVPIFELGKELINTPKNSFNLWSTYKIQRFFFGGGTRFVGRRYGNNINTRIVDSYWLVDAVVSYQLTKNIDLRLNANNLTDKYYIDRIGGGHIVPGAGRVVMLSTGFHF